MSRSRLPDLARLAAIRREVALAALSRAGADRERLRSEIEALRQDVAAARAASAHSADPVVAIGTERLAAWADRKLAGLNVALAARTAVWQECRQDAARAHGQSEVLERLSAAMAEARRIRADRRRPSET